MRIWDRGYYDPVEWTRDHIAFTLHGSRVEGAYALVRFKGRSTNDWLLIKGKG